MRRPVIVLLIIAISALIVPHHSLAGGPKEVAVGAVFGLGTGLIMGGMVMAFYRNPLADKNLETILLSSATAGLAAGMIFGMLLPEGVIDNDPTVSSYNTLEDEWHFSLPTVRVEKKIGKPNAYFSDLFELAF